MHGRCGAVNMWFQIPQICHFVLLCAVPLGLTGVAVYELERSFLMPRESSTLQRLMTSLLSTPFQRTRSALISNHFCYDKKSELMLVRCARAYSSSCLQVILVSLHPSCRSSLFCSQKLPTNH